MAATGLKLAPAAHPSGTILFAMRAEIEQLVQDIEQSVGLLRRHL